MYIYKCEMLAIAVIAGILWAIIPWSPLSVAEGMLAGVYLVIFSAGVVALFEMAVEGITGREFPG